MISSVKTLCITTTFMCLVILFCSCAETFQNQNPLGHPFPTSMGESLDQKVWRLPDQWAGKPTVLLLGYVQDSQFDIDRWLIGLDMRQVQATIYEIPTIKGMIPRMISDRINEGMKSGIPKALWGGVITVYADGEILQRFTGNENSRNARVILIDAKGIIRYFKDEGFSVAGLNELISSLKDLN
jgi:hypothetical protein